MDILIEFAKEIGLEPKKVASTGGGEYHCACPKCGEGTDRFIVWPNRRYKNCIGGYFCRQCETKGDAIQFCREFLGLDWKEAVAKCHSDITYSGKPVVSFEKPKSKAIQAPSDQWQQRAKSFSEWANKQIKGKPDVMDWLANRGLPLEAVDQYLIGYSENPSTSAKYGGFHVPVSEFGLKKEDGSSKTIWIPRGIVIPTIEPSGAVIRIKIRRSDWTPDDKFPKYIAIKGSMQGLNLVGDRSHKAMAVVESELDAYALHHAVKDVAFVVAVGSNTKNPDLFTDYLAKSKKFLLICHDNDEGGCSMWDKWKDLYPHAKAHPASQGKDIGESVQLGVDIREWLLSALPGGLSETLVQ